MSISLLATERLPSAFRVGHFMISDFASYLLEIRFCLIGTECQLIRVNYVPIG